MPNEHEDYDNYDEFGPEPPEIPEECLVCANCVHLGPEETPHSVLAADGDELMVRYCVARCAFAEGDRAACQKFCASDELREVLHYEQLHEHHY